MQVSQQAVASPFDGLTLEQIRSRTSAKWQYYPEDVLPLWVAEMDAVVAQPIVDAVMQALANGDTGYPWGSAFPEALAGFASDRWDWSFDPSKAAPMTDVMTGVLEISRLLGQNDDAIVLTPPIYPPFSKVADVLGRPVVTAPLDSDDRIDLDNLERAFKEATGGGKHATLLLSNPHNPTGTVHSRAELTSIAQLARKHGARVISDEIHAPLVMPTSTFTPYLSVADSGLDFSVTSASKGWNLAGFKAAIAMAGADATSELESLNHRVGTHPGHIGVIAHTAAFNDARVWLDAAIAGIDVNRRLLAELLQEYLPAALPASGKHLSRLDRLPGARPGRRSGSGISGARKGRAQLRKTFRCGRRWVRSTQHCDHPGDSGRGRAKDGVDGRIVCGRRYDPTRAGRSPCLPLMGSLALEAWLRPIVAMMNVDFLNAIPNLVAGCPARG